MYNKLIFEISKKDRIAYSLANSSIDNYELPKKLLRKTKLNLPEVSELDVIRHYTNISQKNYGVESGFYPLGSCTMKYNPKINEEIAKNTNFTNIHPLQPEDTIQGALKVYYDLSNYLSELTGLDKFSFSPFAGAHGELTGLMIMREYFIQRKDYKRTKIIIPDSAHGTNPASSAVVGFSVVNVKSNENGTVDIEALKSLLNDEIAGIMLTNPNTLGLYENDILQISELLHENGSLLYYDGANLNALLGIARPADMGFDIVHLNLHKTFSTPHGGGGPGSGPVGVCKRLIPYLPNPQVIKDDEGYHFYNSDKAIGRISGFYGNFLVYLKAYAYILSIGKEHMDKIAKYSVLNANYIKESLRKYYNLPINRSCMHEVVFDGLISKKASTLDVAKRLLDYGYHPPTIYFPLLFHQSMMIEPVENETKETLDSFIEVMIKIAKEAEEDPELLFSAPHNTVVKRLDEVKAVRELKVKFGDLL